MCEHTRDPYKFTSLITISDYGANSYNFEPLTLLNGGYLLFLLEKHNKKVRIDLKEAKGIYQGGDFAKQPTE